MYKRIQKVVRMIRDGSGELGTLQVSGSEMRYVWEHAGLFVTVSCFTDSDATSIEIAGGANDMRLTWHADTDPALIARMVLAVLVD